MRDRAMVRELAARLPRRLRLMRARQMIETQQESLGVDEVPCPACTGAGWLSRRRLEHCPLCCGFREVPTGLADWFRAQTASHHDDTTSTTNGDARQPERGDGKGMFAVARRFS